MIEVFVACCTCMRIAGVSRLLFGMPCQVEYSVRGAAVERRLSGRAALIGWRGVSYGALQGELGTALHAKLPRLLA